MATCAMSAQRQVGARLAPIAIASNRQRIYILVIGMRGLHPAGSSPPADAARCGALAEPIHLKRRNASDAPQKGDWVRMQHHEPVTKPAMGGARSFA